jgi:hypothetical protein
MNKKKYVIIMAAAFVVLTTSMALADTFTYTHTPGDLGGLQQNYYYYWQLSDTYLTNALQNQQIIGASLTISNVNNEQSNADNMLYIHLENYADAPERAQGNLPSGVGVTRSPLLVTPAQIDIVNGQRITISDPIFSPDTWQYQTCRYSESTYCMNAKGSSNVWEGTGVEIDNDFAISNFYDLSSFLGDMQNYIKDDGIFGLAFDPHGSFANDGVTLTIETGPASNPGGQTQVPEPSSLLMLGSGLMGLFYLSGRSRK